MKTVAPKKTKKLSLFSRANQHKEAYQSKQKKRGNNAPLFHKKSQYIMGECSQRGNSLTNNEQHSFNITLIELSFINYDCCTNFLNAHTICINFQVYLQKTPFVLCAKSAFEGFSDFRISQAVLTTKRAPHPKK